VGKNKEEVKKSCQQEKTKTNKCLMIISAEDLIYPLFSILFSYIFYRAGKRAERVSISSKICSKCRKKLKNENN
jgi:hypothetical protein